jgi:putative pyruvate formate lyase activating enzyme
MDDKIRKALKRYLSVLDGKKSPRFRSTPLSSRAETAKKLLSSCVLCERKCRVDRTAGELGWCKAGDEMKVSSMFEHHGEERFLVPSFTVFFMSCTFSCEFCQNWRISQRVEQGRGVDEKELAKTIDRHSHCRNVNFVGGDPVPYLPMILGSLSHVRADIPVVWNSNFYMSEKSMDLLKEVVDVYLSDWKYGNDACAKRLSKVTDYSGIVRRNHMLAVEDAEVVIRHLVMPGHVECCTKPILKEIHDKFGDGIVVNIMDQYRPEFRAVEHSDISMSLDRSEYDEALSYAEELGISFIK